MLLQEMVSIRCQDILFYSHVAAVFNRFLTNSASLLTGLGGTSLVNANAFLETEQDILKMGYWPPEIRDNPAGLDKCKVYWLSSQLSREARFG